MSKAFTSEDTPDTVILGRPVEVSGAKRLITEAGFQTLRAACQHLKQQIEGADPEARPSLQHQLALKEAILASVDVSVPKDNARALLGCTVTLKDTTGAQRQFRLVGVDEVDAKRGHISPQSPLGAALWGKQVGDSVEFERQSGTVYFEIEAIEL
jgi:transcription elongation factor GreB